MLVRKANGTWRLCVDYQALNQVIIKDKFPIPIVEELMDELHGSNMFSRWDLRYGRSMSNPKMPIKHLLEHMRATMSFKLCHLG